MQIMLTLYNKYIKDPDESGKQITKAGCVAPFQPYFTRANHTQFQVNKKILYPTKSDTGHTYLAVLGVYLPSLGVNILDSWLDSNMDVLHMRNGRTVIVYFR